MTLVCVEAKTKLYLMILEPGARLGGHLEREVQRLVRECRVGQAYLLLQRVARPQDPG